MAKQYKVKRHKGVYGKKKRPVFKVVAVVLGLVLLFFVGYSLSGPIINFFNRQFTGDPPAIIPSSSYDDTSSNSGGDITDPIPVKDARYATIPTYRFLQEDIGTVLRELKEAGITHVMITLKNNEGFLLYPSETAIGKECLAQNTVELKSMVDALREAELIPVAKLAAFKDHQAPKQNGNLAIKYLDTDIFWLDNAPATGKPWINPYEKEGWDYLLSLTKELHTAGFEEFVFDEVVFPVVPGSEYCSYGANAASKTKSQVLGEFLAYIKDGLDDGVPVSLYAGAKEMLTETENYGGVTAASLCDLLVVEGNIDGLSGLELSGYTVPAQITDRAKVIEELTTSLKALNRDVILMLPAGETNISTHLDEVKEALGYSGVYSDSGDYSL